MKKSRKRIVMRRGDYRILFFILTVILCLGTGIFIPELIKMNSGSYAGFFSMYSFGIFQQKEIQMKELFRYLISVRMELFLFMWMSSFSGIGYILHMVTAGWIFCSAGMLLRLFFMKKGLEGGVLFLCCLLPQWLLYFMLWKKELSFCLQRMKGKIHGRKECSVLFLNLLALCIFGCACETWIGIQLQKKFFTYFL